MAITVYGTVSLSPASSTSLPPAHDLSRPFDSNDFETDVPPLYNPDYDLPPALPHPDDELQLSKPDLLRKCFAAVRSSQVELVHLLLSLNEFGINDVPPLGQTFLCAALSTGQNVLAREFIVKYGADVNAWSQEGLDILQRPVMRTPLMVAAGMGNYAAVKMLIEEFGADDGVVGEDGMLALRCAVRAAKEGKGEGEMCVNYLPMRRGGGWKRFKHDHAVTMRVARRTTKSLVSVGKFFVYHLPKFFLWDFPKWLGKKVMKLCVHTYHATIYFFNEIVPKALKATFNGLQKLAKVTGEFIASIPGRLVDLLKYMVFKAPGVIYNICKSLVTEILPKAAVETYRAVVRVSTAVGREGWRFTKWSFTLCAVRIPKALWRFTKSLASWIKEVICVRVPKLLKELGQFLKRGAIASVKTVAGLLASIASALHTFLAFIIRNMGKVTLKDVGNSIWRIFHYILVVIPSKIVEGMVKGFNFTVDAIPKIFGCLGKAVVVLGQCLVAIVLFVPLKIATLLWELVKWVGRGFQEVAVWINPKSKL